MKLFWANFLYVEIKIQIHPFPNKYDLIVFEQKKHLRSFWKTYRNHGVKMHDIEKSRIVAGTLHPLLISAEEHS